MVSDVVCSRCSHVYNNKYYDHCPYCEETLQDSIAKVFEQVFGKGNCKTIVCKPTKKTRSINRAVKKFIARLEAAFEATKNSKLRFT